MVTRSLLFALTCFIAGLQGFYHDSHRLQRKIAEGPPSWMKEQINSDLALFPRIHVAELRRTYNEVKDLPSGHGANLILYRIEKGRVSYECHPSLRGDRRIVDFIAMIEETAHTLSWPDVIFLASIWDSYDAPLYLAHTHAPVLTICKRRDNPYGVLFPEVTHQSHRDWVQERIESEIANYPWSSKKNHAFWRGNSTGGWWDERDWDLKGRARLLFLAHCHPDWIDACLTGAYFMTSQLESYLKRNLFFAPYVWPHEQMKYRYLIAIDGNTFASSFRWQLQTNCVVLKQNSPYLEWYYGALIPYKHYIPVERDLSDLVERLKWLSENEGVAREVAENGRRFFLENLTNEDVILYFFTLMKIYAKRQTFS